MDKQECLILVEQAISHLCEAGTGKQYDPSWCRPKTMTREQINTACEQAYHVMNLLKQKLDK